MNSSDDERQATPDTVSAEYQAIATEQTPESLDRNVLRLASKVASTSSSGGNWLTARIRPLAFVLTAGLSLALLIQLSNTPLMETPPLDPGAEALPDDIFQDAARRTAEQIRQLDTGAGPEMTTPGAEIQPVPVTDNPADLTLLPVEDRCTDSDRAESGTWWECIRDLEKRGLSESAEMELQALLKAHPQFSAPQ